MALTPAGACFYVVRTKAGEPLVLLCWDLRATKWIAGRDRPEWTADPDAERYVFRPVTDEYLTYEATADLFEQEREALGLPPLPDDADVTPAP